MKVKNIKIIAWLFLLAIFSDKATCSDEEACTAKAACGDESDCSDKLSGVAKATCSDKPIPEWLKNYVFDNDVKYKLTWYEEQCATTIEIKTKGGTHYEKRGANRQLICYNNIGEFTRERVTKSLNYFYEQIKKQSAHYITIIGKIYVENLGDYVTIEQLKELIPDKSLLMEYFDGMPSLEYIDLYAINSKRRFCMYRDGSITDYCKIETRDKGQGYWEGCRLPKSRWDVSPESEA